MVLGCGGKIMVPKLLRRVMEVAHAHVWRSFRDEENRDAFNLISIGQESKDVAVFAVLRVPRRQ